MTLITVGQPLVEYDAADKRVRDAIKALEAHLGYKLGNQARACIETALAISETGHEDA